MKRRLWLVLIACLVLSSFTGCANKKEIEEPSVSQIRNICNLATLECYYHNVAKSVKKADAGLLHIGEKDRKFWIEYTGIVKLGIDMSKVEMTIENEKIQLTIPQAKILEVLVDENEEIDYISSQDGLNKNKITAEDQISAIADAQAEMEETAKKNDTLLLAAQNRAIMLVENYINQLGAAAGKEYEITWKYLETE